MSTKTVLFSSIKARLPPVDRLLDWPAVKWLHSLLSELRYTIKDDIRAARIMRFAIGVTLATALAYTVQWPLSFLTPILTSVILALPAPGPSLKASLANMLYTFSAFFIGVVFTLFFLPYPLAYIFILGLTLFHIYYYLNRGGSFWFVLMSLLSILILPMLGNNHEGLAFGFSLGFIWSGWVTILMIWLAHFIIPDPEAITLPAPSKFQPGYSAVAAEAAFKSTIVVLPIVIFFISYNLIDLLIVMVFAAIFTLSPDFSKSAQAGINSIKSTLIGGAAAWLFYWLIVAIPEFYFFIFLMFLTTLVFAQQIFSEKPTASYFGSAFVVLLVLVNSNLEQSGDIFSALVWRLIFISLATLYVVGALKALEHYWPQSSAGNQNKG